MGRDGRGVSWRGGVFAICCAVLTGAWVSVGAQAGEVPLPMAGRTPPTAAPVAQPSSLPATPSLVSPADLTADLELSPTLRWRRLDCFTGCEDQPHYQLQVDNDSTFVSPNLDVNVQMEGNVVEVAFEVPPGVLDGWTWYHWRVRVVNGEGPSGWSDSWQFGTTMEGSGSPPEPPSLEFPLQDSTVPGLTPMLSWSEAVEQPYPAWAFQLQADDDSGFASPAVNAYVWGSEGGTYTVPQGLLAASTRYYWRVRALNYHGGSAWAGGATRWFGTPGAGTPEITSFTASLGYHAPQGYSPPWVGVFLSLPPERWGYVDCPINHFEVTVQDREDTVDHVDFTVSGGPAATAHSPDPQGRWCSDLNMNEVPPPTEVESAGGSVWLYPTLNIVAYDAAGNPSLPYAVTIKTVPAPNWPGPNWAMWYGSPTPHYRLYIEEVPIDPWFDVSDEDLGLPPIDIPYMGEASSTWSVSVRVIETFNIDGEWDYNQATGSIEATVLGIPVVEGWEGWFWCLPVMGDATGPEYSRNLQAYRFPVMMPWFKLGELPTLIAYSYPVAFDLVEMTVSFHIDIGSVAGVVVSGQLDGNLRVDPNDPLRVTSSGGAYVQSDATVDAYFGVASCNVKVRTSADLLEAVLYNPAHDPIIYADDPRLHVVVDTRFTGKILWFFPAYDSGWIPMYDYWWPSEPAAAVAQGSQRAEPLQGDGELSLLAAPDLAWNRDADVGLLLWVDDRDPTAEAVDPDLGYELLAPSGEVLAQGYVAENDRYETDPRVAWRPPHPETGGPRAVAVWTQNEIPRAEAGAYDHVEAVLAQQEIYAALWGEDGSPGWSAPVRLTQNQVPDGRAALAVDPEADRALVAWVRDQDSLVSTPGSLDICLRSYEAGEWTPEIVMRGPEVADLEPAVACQGGRSALVWVSDADADITTNPDRVLWYMTNDGTGWSAPQPVAGSEGALYPSVDFDPSGQPVIAFCQRLDGEDGPGGEGTSDFLRYAFLTDGQWVVGRPGDQDTRGQWPQIRVSDDNVATLVFRSLEVDGVARLPGEPARVEVDLGQGDAPEAERSSPPTCLTDDDSLDWQIAFDLGQSDVSHIITMTDVLRDGMMPTGAAEVAPNIWFFTTTRLPGRPVITAPGSWTVLTDAQQPQLTIAGTAPAEATSVALYGDGRVVQVLPCVDGQWAVETTVPPGRTEYRAASRNVVGESPKSLPVTVIWNVFSDLPDDHWALDQIMAAYVSGIVAGYPDGTYRPAQGVDRAQMAVYISRALAGGDDLVPTGPAEATFSDVPSDHWAFKWVEYAADWSVVGGYPDGTYRPTLGVDRGQMAVFIARAMRRGDASVPTGPATASFPDVPTDHWAFKHVEYIRGEDVTGGYPDTKYHPEYACTRDQMAVFVQRAFGLPT